MVKKRTIAADPETEPKVEETAAVETKETETVKPSTATRGIVLGEFVENHKTIDEHPVGSGFRRWCELEDPENLRTRKPDTEWRALFEKFINREVT
jgi:hypothetical protein